MQQKLVEGKQLTLSRELQQHQSGSKKAATSHPSLFYRQQVAAALQTKEQTMRFQNKDHQRTQSRSAIKGNVGVSSQMRRSAIMVKKNSQRKNESCDDENSSLNNRFVDVMIPKVYAANKNDASSANLKFTKSLKAVSNQHQLLQQQQQHQPIKRESINTSNHLQSSSELSTRHQHKGVKGTAFYMKHYQKGKGSSEMMSIGNTHISQGTAPTEKELTTLGGARQSISQFPSEVNQFLKFTKQAAGQTKQKQRRLQSASIKLSRQSRVMGDQRSEHAGAGHHAYFQCFNFDQSGVPKAMQAQKSNVFTKRVQGSTYDILDPQQPHAPQQLGLPIKASTLKQKSNNQRHSVDGTAASNSTTTALTTFNGMDLRKSSSIQRKGLDGYKSPTSLIKVHSSTKSSSMAHLNESETFIQQSLTTHGLVEGYTAANGNTTSTDHILLAATNMHLPSNSLQTINVVGKLHLDDHLAVGSAQSIQCKSSKKPRKVLTTALRMNEVNSMTLLEQQPCFNNHSSRSNFARAYSNEVINEYIGREVRHDGQFGAKQTFSDSIDQLSPKLSDQNNKNLDEEENCSLAQTTSEKLNEIDFGIFRSSLQTSDNDQERERLQTRQRLLLMQEGGTRSQVLLKASPRVIFESNETAHSDHRASEKAVIQTGNIQKTSNIKTKGGAAAQDSREIGSIVILDHDERRGGNPSSSNLNSHKGAQQPKLSSTTTAKPSRRLYSSKHRGSSKHQQRSNVGSPSLSNHFGTASKTKDESPLAKHLIKVVPDAARCPVLEQRKLISESYTRRQGAATSTGVRKHRNPQISLSCCSPNLASQQQQQQHQSANQVNSQQLRAGSGGGHGNMSNRRSHTGLMLSSNQKLTSGQNKIMNEPSRPLTSLVKSSKYQKCIFSETNFDLNSDLEQQMKNNLQNLIDDQIRLDDKLITKQKRAQKVIETSIAKSKNLVARKYAHTSYLQQRRIRLHQRSIFHQKYLKNDMPPNFWASKAMTSPKENQELYDKHQQLVNLIHSPSGDGVDHTAAAYTEDDDRLMAELKNELIKGGEEESKTGMTEKGLELALWFYQKQQDKLPPRKIANADTLHIKMPIPFERMAGEQPPNEKRQFSEPVSRPHMSPKCLSQDYDGHGDNDGETSSLVSVQDDDDEDQVVQEGTQQFGYHSQNQFEPLIGNSPQNLAIDQSNVYIKNPPQTSLATRRQDELHKRQVVLTKAQGQNATTEKTQSLNEQDLHILIQQNDGGSIALQTDSGQFTLQLPSTRIKEMLSLSNSGGNMSATSAAGMGPMQKTPFTVLMTTTGQNLEQQMATGPAGQEEVEVTPTISTAAYANHPNTYMVSYSRDQAAAPDGSTYGPSPQEPALVDLQTEEEVRHRHYRAASQSKSLIEELSRKHLMSVQSPPAMVANAFYHHQNSQQQLAYHDSKDSLSMESYSVSTTGPHLNPLQTYLTDNNVWRKQTLNGNMMAKSVTAAMPIKNQNFRNIKIKEHSISPPSRKADSVHRRSTNSPSVLANKQRKKSKSKSKNALRNHRNTVVNRLYPGNGGSHSLMSMGSMISQSRANNMNSKKLRTTTDPDPAELDHSKWLNYVSSAQHLQSVAHVLEKNQVGRPVRPGEQQESTCSEQVDGPMESLDTEAEKTRKEEEVEKRRQYLLSAKKSRKYVASTLFHGRYSQSSCQAAAKIGRPRNSVGGSSFGGSQQGLLTMSGKHVTSLAASQHNNHQPEHHYQRKHQHQESKRSIKYIQHPLKMLVIQQ